MAGLKVFERGGSTLAPRSPAVASRIAAHPSCLVENVNSGHSLPRERRRRCWPTRTGILLEVSAAMACPSGRVDEQLERHDDKHRFPMRIWPGDRPPGAEVRKSPLNVELLQALEGRSGNWAALRLFEGAPIADRLSVADGWARDYIATCS